MPKTYDQLRKIKPTLIESMNGKVHKTWVSSRAWIPDDPRYAITYHRTFCGCKVRWYWTKVDKPGFSHKRCKRCFRND